ncbi:MAG TPA: FAD-dependent oxidoreductase [Ktedonobacteraceae bacterium]|nr:FAD-dependent oxidoreductase [Ktedonobacteraceae bacterium]
MQSRQEKALAPKQSGDSYMDRADFVIIGNGIAGLTAAVEARKLAPQKRIVIITDQIYPTINTPALKQFAIGKLDREQLLAYPSGTERRERIHVVTSRVEEIHARSKYITLKGNRGFGYDKLLIATGSTPSGLPAQTPGRDFDGVMTMHRLEDYVNLRRRLPEVRDAIVVGGGVHAIETVMGLLHYDIHVHWLIRGTTFMARMIDDVSSAMVLEEIRRSGAQVHTETEIVGIVGRMGSVAGVITNQQEMIPCQLVLTCTGTQPVLALAKNCSLPLKIQNGIQVDDQLHTNVPDIFAAGDVAALKNPLTNKYEPRAQWYAAVDQGRIVGAMLAGREDLANEPFGVHWHATHLGELSMLTVGEPLKEGPQVITLTDSNSKGYRRAAIIDDRLVGYLSLGKAQPDSLAIKRIVDEGLPVRAIIRDLLRGDFDARKYVAQVRTQAAQGIITRQLPPLADTLVQRRPAAAEPFVIPGARQERALPPPPRQTGPLQPQRTVAFEEERVNAFTGSLPTLSRVYEPGELTPGSKQTEPLQERSEATFEEETFNAFTGSLPRLSRIYEPGELMPDSRAARGGQAIPRRENTASAEPVPVETPEWRNGQPQKAWSYTEDTKTPGQGQQSPAPTGKTPPKRTGGLWAYNEKNFLI